MTVDQITTPPPTLTAHERCCATASGSEAAQVTVQLTYDTEPLLFCGHHYDLHKAALEARLPVLIHDTRDLTPINRQQGESYS